MLTRRTVGEIGEQNIRSTEANIRSSLLNLVLTTSVQYENQGWRIYGRKNGYYEYNFHEPFVNGTLLTCGISHLWTVRIVPLFLRADKLVLIIIIVLYRYRLVTAVGDAYGFALLLHMLTTTITLTLLAYQATKVSALPDGQVPFQGPEQMTY